MSDVKFDTADEWFESLDESTKYEIIMEFTDSDLEIYYMTTFEEAYSEEFAGMTALSIVEYVQTYFKNLNPDDDFWGVNTYGNIISDSDVLWLAECAGMNMKGFWKWLEEEQDRLMEEY